MAISASIDLTEQQKEEILSLFARYLPGTKVWAYGSRVKFNARPDSDLDLVCFTTPEQSGQFYTLKEQFEESNLPFRIDLLEWNNLPDNFKENISKQHVEILIPANRR